MKWDTDKKLIIYHTNWATYDRNFQVKDIPIEYISDLNYAFLDLKPNSEGFYVPALSDAWADTDKKYSASDSVFPADTMDKYPCGNFGQFLKLKQLGHRFSFGLSIGGWSFSKYFSLAARTVQSRVAFVQECIALLDQFGNLVDRIDLDWEHVSPNCAQYGAPGNIVHLDDGRNYGYLLELLRNQLDVKGYERIRLSACVTAEVDQISALPLSIMSIVLETINVMTYDFASSDMGNCNSRHHTNLFNSDLCPSSVDSAVKAYLNAGVPPNKITIGAAFYSRGFANTFGLGSPASGIVTDKSWENGVCDYKSLPRDGAIEYYDNYAHAAYSYDPQKRILNSYDNVDSIRAKCRYVWQMNLKGIIVWESSGDFPVVHPRSLTAALYRGLAFPPW
jgi:chitinase